MLIVENQKRKMKPETMQNAPILAYSDVELSRDIDPILSNINVEIRSGEFVYLIGKVGSGKSTFLQSIYCELSVNKGDARVFDYQLKGIKSRCVPYLRRKIGIVFQDFQLLTDRSVTQNLEFVLKATGWKNKALITQRIEEVLADVGMQNKGYKLPHELSGGEQQRIVIARALLNSPEIILADEPTGNLDPETGNQIVQLLYNISKQGTAVLMSTHNYTVMQRFKGRVLKCEDGYLKEVM